MIKRFLPISLAFLAITPAFSDDSVGIDLFSLSLEQLLNIEVVTVSSMLQENSFTASATVDSVSRKEWQQQGGRFLVDTLQHVPGVYTSYNLVANDAISIRGNSSSPGTRGIAMRFDGVPLNGMIFSTALYHAEGFSLGLLDKVDIIRGPGSALYGADAFQGVISLKSRELQADDTLVEIKYGGDAYSAANLAMARNFNGWKVTAVIDTRDANSDIEYDYGNSVVDKNLQYSRSVDFEREISSGLVKVNKAFANDWHFDASYLNNRQDRYDVRRLGPGLPDPLITPNRTIYDDFDNSSALELVQAKFTGQISNEIELSMQAYSWDADWRWGVVNPSMINIFRQEYRETRDGFIGTIKNDNANQSLNWSAGIEHSNQTDKRDRLGVGFKGFTFAPVTDTGWPVINNGEGYTRYVTSGFGELRYNMSRQWLLNLGLRADDYSDFDRQWSPRLGIIYQPQSSTAIKLLYGSAFRAPAINEINYEPSPSIGFTLGNEAIKPEIVHNYELIFMKSTAMQSFELAVYYTVIHDGIVRQPIADSPLDQFTYFNTAELKSKGAEFKYGIQWNNVTNNIAVSYADAEDKGSNISLDAYPEWMIDWGLGYSWPDSQLEMSINSRLMLNRKAYQRTSLEQSPSELDNYSRFDFHLMKTMFKRWQFSLDVTNLLDRNNNVEGQIGVNETRIPEDGITTWLGVKYSY
jgi:outer membrane receptor protein involved in Fe transport